MYFTDIELLKRKAAMNGASLESIANETGIGSKVLNQRIRNGKFLIGEIQNICSILKLSSLEAKEVFMCQKTL